MRRMANNANSLYEFGPYRLDPNQRVLMRGNQPVPLQPKAFETLLILVQNNQRIMLKDDLLNLIWPDSFVEESNLSQNIFVLRKALGNGDGDGARRYIQTVPGRGYCFAQQVRTVPLLSTDVFLQLPPAESFEEGDGNTLVLDLPETREPVSEPRSPAPSPSKWGVAWAAAIAVAIAASVFIYQSFHSRVPRVLDVQRLTYSERIDPYGRIHSDGSRLFYLERYGDHWNTMQIAIAGGPGQLFPSPLRPNTKLMGLSPDHAEMLVAPFVARTGNLPLWSMPLVGGAARRIGDIVATDASFSPDGKKIVYSTNDAIMVADPQGDSRTRLAPCHGECRALAWSPDGTRIRYTQVDLNTDRRAIWEIPSKGGEPRPLLPNWNNPPAEAGGRWTADGRYFIFVSSQNGRRDLWALREGKLSLAGGSPRPVRLTSGPYEFKEPLASADGKYIYATSGTEDVQMLRFDRATGTTKPLPNGAHTWELRYSPDGKRMFFIVDDVVWRSNADGRETVKLFQNSAASGKIYHLEVTPDGKNLLVALAVSGGPPVYSLLPTEGGALKALDQIGHPFFIPSFSPDGDSLIVGPDTQTAERSPSEARLFLYKRSTGEKREIPGSEGLYMGRWSPDGKRIAALTVDLTVLKILDVNSNRWSSAVTGNYFLTPFWVDSHHLFVQDLLAPGEPIFRISAADTLKAERAFSFEDILRSGPVRCAFNGLTPDSSPLLLITTSGSDLYSLRVDLP